MSKQTPKAFLRLRPESPKAFPRKTTWASTDTILEEMSEKAGVVDVKNEAQKIIKTIPSDIIDNYPNVVETLLRYIDFKYATKEALVRFQDIVKDFVEIYTVVIEKRSNTLYYSCDKKVVLELIADCLKISGFTTKKTTKNVNGKQFITLTWE